MMDVICVTCGRQQNKRLAEIDGWLIKPKVTGLPGELFVICANCLNLGSATLDVVDSAPFRRLAKEVRQKRVVNGNNERVR